MLYLALTVLAVIIWSTCIERFWFASPNLRLRTSTVQRFGGFNTATFCTEMRVEQPILTPDSAGVDYDQISGW